MRKLISFTCIIAAVLCVLNTIGSADTGNFILELDDDIEINMIHIDPGTFIMGSDARSLKKSRPAREITITRGFHISEMEITCIQYEAVTGFSKKCMGILNNRPADELTWYDAVVFCNRLSELSGCRSCYYADAGFASVFDGPGPGIKEGAVFWDRSADGFRLPTEAEWEYACRAGTTGEFSYTPDEHYFSENRYAVYEGSAGSMSNITQSKVGSKEPNPWGLYDMHGNVAEFCWDWYDAYPAGSATNPDGPGEGRTRVLRGGSFVSDPMDCRSAARNQIKPGSSGGATCGIRLVKSGGSAPVLAPKATQPPENRIAIPVHSDMPEPTLIPNQTETTIPAQAAIIPGTHAQTDPPQEMKPEYKYCPECGTKVVPGAKFCVECGKRLVSDEKNRH